MNIESSDNRDKFTVPAGYFEEFEKKILLSTCNKKQHITTGTRKINWFKWTSYAATVAIVATITAATISHSIKEQKAEEIAATVLPAKTNNAGESAGDEEYIDNMLQSYPIDDYEFYCFATNTSFE